MTFHIVDAQNLKTLEQFAGSVISSIATLRTLELFQTQALRIGILSEDESEISKTINWEIKRLIGLYSSQMTSILERADIDEQEIIETIKKMIPSLKISKKKKKDEIHDLSASLD